MTKPIIGIGSDVLHKKGERERAFAYTTYIESLQRAGAVPVVIPPQPENAEAIVDGLDGVLLAGGDDCDPSVYGEERHPSVEPMDPRRQNNELALARVARERGVPTLGICLGVQWHPEDMAAESSATSLFGAFVDAARKYAEKKRNASTDLSPVGAAETE